jgi:hypothetical protein
MGCRTCWRRDLVRCDLGMYCMHSTSLFRVGVLWSDMWISALKSGRYRCGHDRRDIVNCCSMTGSTLLLWAISSLAELPVSAALIRLPELSVGGQSRVYDRGIVSPQRDLVARAADDRVCPRVRLSTALRVLEAGGTSSLELQGWQLTILS